MKTVVLASVLLLVAPAAATGVSDRVCALWFACVDYDVDSEENTSADCEAVRCEAVLTISGSGDAQSDCGEEAAGFICSAIAVAPQGSATSECGRGCLNIVAVSGDDAIATTMDCQGCLAAVAASRSGDARSAVECYDCLTAAIAPQGNASSECRWCTATFAVGGDSAFAHEQQAGKAVAAASHEGDANATCDDWCSGAVSAWSASGDASALCSRVCSALVAGSGTGNASARTNCRSSQCVVASLSGTGTAFTTADCRSGCPTVHAASLLGEAKAHCDGCAPVAVAGGSAEATCRFRSCIPVAVGLTNDASVHCAECDRGGMIPQPGAAVSVFGDATTSCSGDCSESHFVAVSGTGRASGERAVSGCEAGETVGTGELCRRVDRP